MAFNHLVQCHRVLQLRAVLATLFPIMHCAITHNTEDHVVTRQPTNGRRIWDRPGSVYRKWIQLVTCFWCELLRAKPSASSKPGVIHLHHHLVCGPNTWVCFRNWGRITLLLKSEIARHGLHPFSHEILAWNVQLHLPTRWRVAMLLELLDLEYLHTPPFAPAITFVILPGVIVLHSLLVGLALKVCLNSLIRDGP